jgi:hypothetical protein
MNISIFEFLNISCTIQLFNEDESGFSCKPLNLGVFRFYIGVFIFFSDNLITRWHVTFRIFDIFQAQNFYKVLLQHM